MFHHTDLYGNSVESPSEVCLDQRGEYAVVNCPSDELRTDLVNQYYSEIHSGKRIAGDTIFFPRKTGSVTPKSKAEQWL